MRGRFFEGGPATATSAPAKALFGAAFLKTLALALFMLTAQDSLQAQNAPGQEGPRVMLEASLEPPEVGSTWTLTVLSDHANPHQVRVIEPPFAEGLFLEQVMQGPRLVHLGAWLAGPAHSAAYERWTATEYRFVVNGYGTFAFDSFTVVTPLGQARTQPFELEVRSPQAAAGMRSRAAQWSGAPQSLRVGDSQIFTLRLVDGDSSDPAPRPALFMPEVPPGHILESLPISAEDKALGTALRLRLIPLEAGAFVLEGRVFAYGGAVFEIPALSIPVGQSEGRLAIAGRDAQAAAPVADAGPAQPFPSMESARDANPRLFRRRAAEFEAGYLAALNLWERGYHANALAVLRQHERDSRAGALFASVRRDAEAALGIFGTRDERRRLFGFRVPFFRERTRVAVLRETAVRRVPDPGGEEIARFVDGQPVTIASGETVGRGWTRVTASDGTSGWIPGENIILY